jgi:PAS domain S-box-containing protein
VTSTGSAVRLDAVLGALAEGVLVVDEAHRIVAMNAEAERLLGVSADDSIGRTVDDVACAWALRDGGPFAVSKLRHHLHRAIPYRNDDAFVAPRDGGVLHVSLVATPTDLGDGRPGAVVALRDISGFKAVANGLRESEERFRTTFRLAPIGMVRVDVSGCVTESNDAFGDIVGRAEAELIGVELAALVHPDEQDDTRHAVEDLLHHDGPPWQAERRWSNADGALVTGNTSLARVRGRTRQADFAIGVVEDLTERRRLEVELRRAQKLESVGRLAAGIAHEINTPIQFIGDNVRFLADAFGALQPLATGHGDGGDSELEFLLQEAPQALDETLAGVQRVATIVRAMKAFGHPDRGVWTVADLNHAVETTLVVARSETKDVADVVTDLGPLPLVPCQLGDVNQVLLNLVINAAHAVTDGGGRGRIDVVTRQEGEQVVVAVRDSGTGIPEEVRDRIFDLFFTTKKVGRGTGQGLALAKAVVDQHGGTLTFESEVGRGTTFYLRLPVAPAPSQLKEES